MEIIFEKGYAIEKDADVIVNSANGFLMLGSSGAGKIREASQKLNFIDKLRYKRLMNSLEKQTQEFYRWNYNKYRFTPTIAQLSCLKLLKKKPGHRYRMGEAVLDTGWSKTDKRPIIHAVGMTYKLHGKTHKRIHGTKVTIFKAIRSAVNIIKGIEDIESVALPVMAARKSYGISPKESLNSILKALKPLEKTNIKKIIICFDNKETAAYLKKIKAC